MESQFPTLFSRSWPARGLDNAIASVDPAALCAEYAALREAAPRRPAAGKPYFVMHQGAPATTAASNRLEEHLAIALFNLGRHWPRPAGGWFRLLDYQVPLKARQADARIGKIDLLGVTNRGRLMITELKIESHSGGRSDPPPAALVEGLRYAAVLEANLEEVASEAERRFGMKVARRPPIVQLLAPRSWWCRWLELSAAGDWGTAFVRLTEAVEARSGLTVECLALDDVQVTYGSNGRPPRLDRVPALHSVRLSEAPPIGGTLSLPMLGREAMTPYLDNIFVALWDWAERKHAGQLNGCRRRGRPPVLEAKFAELNVLVPPEQSLAAEIRASVRPEQRHRHFASLRSSQALAQSVFGAISAFDKLDVLEDIAAECGRPAFFQDHRGWTLGFEHELETLGEPRPTSIDVLLSRRDRRIAIECKFTEEEFGTCSRPRLKPGDRGFPEQHCDGNYRVQAGRSERCALTEVGVRYWGYLPNLFDWPARHDHEPCPFGPVYQLARNALAAVVTPDGRMDPTRGHALILYDARNPAFQVGGQADLQWEAAIAACIVPGVMRRLTWQRLLSSIAAMPDLVWLVDALRDKYALAPD